MKNFKDICLELDDFFEKNKDDISANQYQSYLGLKSAVGRKINKLSSDEIKQFTSQCVEKSYDGLDIYDYSAAIAVAIYIDKAITLERLEKVPTDYIIECYNDDRIYRIGNYEEDLEMEHDDF